GKIWLTLIILLRLLVTTLAGYPLYQDEQERFVCNTIQPGCSNVCYDLFSPMSHFRFWLIQIVTLCLPYAIFCVYVIHKVTKRIGSDSYQPYNRIKASSVRKLQQATFKRASLTRTTYEVEKQKIPEFLGAYVFQLLLRTIAEAGFGAGQYYLYGFFVPQRFVCHQPPCTSMVDCYISRPTEKTIMINFMFGINAMSFLLNVVDLIYVVKRTMRQNH
uniref:Gap junction protein n=2 Tax=Latimeria chalumnae TaxID=7897 RepID=H2ZZM5_LATCH